jgi:hypothetical protein
MNWMFFRGGFTVFGSALLCAALGCGGDDDDDGETEPSCSYQLAGTCVGVPAASCDGAACAQGIACAATRSVADDAALAAAAADAQPGECIALGAGTYAAVVLPGGVSLLGSGVARTTIAGIEVGAGSGAVVRGLSVGAGGLRLDGALEARVDEVRVQGASGDGVRLEGGASATMRGVEVIAAAAAGVRVLHGDLRVESSVVADGGPGVVAKCDGGCDCMTPVSLTLTDTMVIGNEHVGIYAAGATATLDGVLVADTTVMGLEPNSGGGVVAAACSTLSATGLEVADSDLYGVLVDSSSGKLGAPGEENGIIIHGNVMGIWLQGVGTEGLGSLEIDNALVENNQGVGIGVGGGAKGIIIHGSQIKKTTARVLTVAGGGSEEVGDGLLWTGAAQVSVDGLGISESARQGVLIDGPVATGSTIAHLVLSAGDEAKGVVQQSIETGGESPAVGAEAPAISTETAQVFAVPQPPTAPATE